MLMDRCQLHYIFLVKVYSSILGIHCYFLPAAYILNVNTLPFGKKKRMCIHTTLRSGLLGHPDPAEMLLLRERLACVSI